MSHQRTCGPVLAVLCVAIASQAGAAAPANVTEWAAAFVTPTLGGTGVPVAGRTLAYGHLELRLADGSLFPVVVGEKVVGAFFTGTGEFRYTSTDPLEAASYASNVRHDTDYEIGKDGVIKGSITGALVMLSAGAEAITGKDWEKDVAPATAEAWTSSARKAFSEHLERFGKDWVTRYTQLMPQAMVDPPASPVVVAEIATKDDDLSYVLDPMRQGDEDLVVLKKIKDAMSIAKGRRYDELLSKQPVGRQRLAPRPTRFTLTDVDLTLRNPEGMKCELEVTEVFKATVPVRVLDLSLWSRIFVSKGPTGVVAEADYVLKSVSITGGPALAFAHTDGDLLVELPKLLAAGETVSLSFVIGGDVLYRPGGDNYWELGLSPWLPLPNRWDLASASYHAVVKVAKPFVPFSCGQTVRRWQEGELECAEFREERATEGWPILAGKYTTVSDERNGVTVRVSAYAIAKPKAMKKLVDLAFTFMDFYRNFLGDYPFKELDIIEINSYGFGQAPPGVIFITKEAFSPMLEEESRLFSEGINARVAHELAHAWWGHVAKLGADEDQWLSESVSQYYAAYAMQKLGGERYFTQASNEWKTWVAHVKDQGTVYNANYLSGREGREERTALLYGKGPLVLHALRQELGDQMFFTILKSYLKSFYFKPATTANFIGLTNFVTKKDNADWFNRYLFGTEWPK